MPTFVHGKEQFIALLVSAAIDSTTCEPKQDNLFYSIPAAQPKSSRRKATAMNTNRKASGGLALSRLENSRKSGRTPTLSLAPSSTTGAAKAGSTQPTGSAKDSAEKYHICSSTGGTDSAAASSIVSAQSVDFGK